MTTTYHPSARPLPAGWLDAIWRATQAGALTWQDAEHLQTIAAPRCLTHNLPIKTLDNGGECVRCVEDRLGDRHMRITEIT